MNHLPKAVDEMKSLKRMRTKKEPSGGDLVLQRTETKRAQIKRWGVSEIYHIHCISCNLAIPLEVAVLSQMFRRMWLPTDQFLIESQK